MACGVVGGYPESWCWGWKSSVEDVTNPSLGRRGVPGTASNEKGCKRSKELRCYKALPLECSLNLFLTNKEGIQPSHSTVLKLNQIKGDPFGQVFVWGFQIQIPHLIKAFSELCQCFPLWCCFLFPPAFSDTFLPESAVSVVVSFLLLSDYLETLKREAEF